MSIEIHDCLGHPIEVGDTIAYAMLKYRSASMTIFRVDAITEAGNIRGKKMMRNGRADSWDIGEVSTLYSPKEKAIVIKGL